MQDNGKITVYMPAGEAREARMRAAIEADKQGRFAWGGNASDLPGDVQFRAVDKLLDVELKDFTGEGNSDYLASILNGHLWDQVTRATGPYVIVVLGDDNDVGAAIRKAASRNHRMDPKKLMQYYEMVEGFEANCIALGVPVWRLKIDPYKRMLLRVRKILQGGDLSGFHPSPAEGERQAVGLAILAGRGIGPVKARAILQKFRIALEPLDCDNCLTDCDGIGEKLATQISQSMAIDSSRLIVQK